MHIVFFDSGLGGLNTLKVALAKLPHDKFIYFGDTANVPYGTKSPADVRHCLVRALDYLKNYDLKALVLACNTATSVAADFLRSKYSFPIIGMEPAIKPAIEKVAASGRRVLLLATILTLKSRRIADLRARVDLNRQIDAVPCSELVDFAERLEFDQGLVKDFLAEKLAPFDLAQYGCVVLGSTHFNYFQEALAGLFPAGTEIIDGNDGTVRHLAEILGRQGQETKVPEQKEVLLHLSDVTDRVKIEAAREMLSRAAPKARLLVI